MVMIRRFGPIRARDVRAERREIARHRVHHAPSVASARRRRRLMIDDDDDDDESTRRPIRMSEYSTCPNFSVTHRLSTRDRGLVSRIEGIETPMKRSKRSRVVYP